MLVVGVDLTLGRLWVALDIVDSATYETVLEGGTCNTPNARRWCWSLAFPKNSEGVWDTSTRSVSQEEKDFCSSLSFRIVSLEWQWMHLDRIYHLEECLWKLKNYRLPLSLSNVSRMCLMSSMHLRVSGLSWRWGFITSFCSLHLMVKSLFIKGYSPSFAKSISSRILFSLL